MHSDTLSFALTFQEMLIVPYTFTLCYYVEKERMSHKIWNEPCSDSTTILH